MCVVSGLDDDTIVNLALDTVEDDSQYSGTGKARGKRNLLDIYGFLLDSRLLLDFLGRSLGHQGLFIIGAEIVVIVVQEGIHNGRLGHCLFALGAGRSSSLLGTGGAGRSALTATRSLRSTTVRTGSGRTVAFLTAKFLQVLSVREGTLAA